MKNKDAVQNKSGGALFVALGIFLSRILGLVRLKVFAHYFGNSLAADAFNAAVKIPNLLQNLFGEGVLSASFIPVYSRLLAEGKKEEAGRVASVVASLLFAVTSVVVLIGVLLTPLVIDLIAPGFEGEKRALTILLVQIIFPGTGILVLSAWCLGVLNSHRRFFLPYVAPALFNVVMILTLFLYGGAFQQESLVVKLAWGFVVASLVQMLLQLPLTLRLVSGFRPELNLAQEGVKTVIRNFFPVVVARGVVQISAYVDVLLASLLVTGAVSAISYAQAIYLLPISLFGMSISAAELPVMSSVIGPDSEVSAKLRERLNASLKRLAFFIVPTIIAFVFLGNSIVALLYQGGKFSSFEAFQVWMVLIGATIGLWPMTMGRLYSSTYYALKDTRRPLNFALIRVVVSCSLGAFLGLYLPERFGLENWWGAVGLTAASAIGGWVEFFLLRRGLRERVGSTCVDLMSVLKLVVSGAFGTGVANALGLFTDSGNIYLSAFIRLALFGGVFLSLCYFLQVPEVKTLRKLFKR